MAWIIAVGMCSSAKQGRGLSLLVNGRRGRIEAGDGCDKGGMAVGTKRPISRKGGPNHTIGPCAAVVPISITTSTDTLYIPALQSEEAPKESDSAFVVMQEPNINWSIPPPDLHQPLARLTPSRHSLSTTTSTSPTSFAFLIPQVLDLLLHVASSTITYTSRPVPSSALSFLNDLQHRFSV
ncbi:hypothetical protein DL546_005944 [Coniochaeta pulveracea]|uniref:Uncharacterized protein n=1 Tax=Coniochaeta pulveracea TaxID=177199 RepID=A0A420YI51_9PEZI|nr:hypothetical protein DL546_005944 [Coniochaeta pulveracea]